MNLLETLHSDIQDFEFVCEGEMRRLGAGFERGKQEAIDVYQFRFQASYIYRADGAGSIDLYQKPFDDRAPWLHDVETQIGGELTGLVESPDSRGGRLPPSVSKGVPGSLNFGGSPERFIFLSYWRGLKYSVSSVGFEYEGWEEIAGTSALRFVINHTSQSKHRNGFWSRYWIDLSRGGHVLKCESYVGSNLRTRLHDVVLASISPAKGKQVWLPIHGEFETFLRAKRDNDKRTVLTYSVEPVFRETYKVVPGSIVINRGLKDDVFTSVWKGKKTVPSALVTVRNEFSRAAQKTKPPPMRPMRKDPAGAQHYLEKQLAEADHQAKQLDASPPGRRGWESSTLIQGGLAALGVGVLIAAFITRRRSS